MNAALIVDTEATDRDPKTAKVIELAELKLSGDPYDLMRGVFGQAYGSLYHTDTPIKWGAMAVHHILPSDLEGQLEFHHYDMPEGFSYLVGHNIDYDAELMKVDPSVKKICTLALARFLLPDLDAHNQTALVYYISHIHGEIESGRKRLQNAHRATDDVKNCAYVFQYLLCKAVEQGHNVDTWEAVWVLSENARIPTRMPFGKHAGDLIRHVPASYVKWYRGTDNQDKYLVEAFRRAGLTY